MVYNQLSNYNVAYQLLMQAKKGVKEKFARRVLCAVVPTPTTAATAEGA
jgi:prophage antirepressor-like protein